MAIVEINPNPTKSPDLCGVPACSNFIFCKSLCKAHYARQYRHGSTERKLILQPKLKTQKPKCEIVDCGRLASFHKRSGRILCGCHASRWNRYRTTDLQPKTQRAPEPCRHENCQSYAAAHGFCPAHYKQFKRATLASKIVTNNKKICTKCQQEKTLDHFHKNPGCIANIHSWCKECVLNQNKVKHKERLESRLRRSYGLSVEAFHEMLEKQKQCCAICETPFASFGKDEERNTHVDHDHVSGKVRGLLCPHCNRGIGSFKDNPQSLRRAALYLEPHRGVLADF